jgi:hypothetical protein
MRIGGIEQITAEERRALRARARLQRRSPAASGYAAPRHGKARPASPSAQGVAAAASSPVECRKNRTDSAAQMT